MAKPIKFDESGDSQDLQALFDSIAAGAAAPPPLPAADASGDNPELQALFDSVAAQNQEAGEHSGGEVFQRLGQMTRALHNSLRELGYDKMLDEATKKIPDARERLSYIAQMTEQAASRALNAVDIAQPIQESLKSDAESLSARWEKLFTNQLSVDDFKALAGETRAYLKQVPEKTQAIGAQLTEIMMAQDFQDLTGQVIKKVVDMAQNMEAQLLKLLVESMPEEVRAEAPEGLLNGPVINAIGRSDVVTSQAQVDDLLESLGF